MKSTIAINNVRMETLHNNNRNLIIMEEHNSQTSRRKFIRQSGVLGAAVMLVGTSQLFAEADKINNAGNNIKSKGYAEKDEPGKLLPWNFERRAVGDNDILIEIKYSDICHSDIHTIRGHWGKQQYPQVPWTLPAIGIISARNQAMIH
jgi:alcohol dehydrogenase (NADP+)